MEYVFKIKKGQLMKWGYAGAGFAAAGLLLLVIVLLLFGNLFNENTIRENIFQLFPVLTGILGGAAGGLAGGLAQHSLKLSGWKSYISVGLGILIYLTIIWMSLILGFSAIGQWD